MEYLLGFGIALLIGLLGVGGGVITAPVLTIFFAIPPAEAVGTALIFTAVVKLTAAPIYLFRRTGEFPRARFATDGRMSGVLLGSYALAKVSAAHQKGPILGVLGATVVVTALMNLYRMARSRKKSVARPRRPAAVDRPAHRR